MSYSSSPSESWSEPPSFFSIIPTDLWKSRYTGPKFSRQPGFPSEAVPLQQNSTRLCHFSSRHRSRPICPAVAPLSVGRRNPQPDKVRPRPLGHGVSELSVVPHSPQPALVPPAHCHISLAIHQRSQMADDLGSSADSNLRAIERQRTKQVNPPCTYHACDISDTRFSQATASILRVRRDATFYDRSQAGTGCRTVARRCTPCHRDLPRPIASVTNVATAARTAPALARSASGMRPSRVRHVQAPTNRAQAPAHNARPARAHRPPARSGQGK